MAEWWPQWQQFMFQATALGKKMDVSYEYPPDPDMIHAFTQHIMTNAVDQ